MRFMVEVSMVESAPETDREPTSSLSNRQYMGTEPDSLAFRKPCRQAQAHCRSSRAWLEMNSCSMPQTVAFWRRYRNRS